MKSKAFNNNFAPAVTFSLLFFLFFSTITLSQNTPLSTIDTLKSEILKTLNNNTWTFYYQPDKPGGLAKINLTEKITFDNNEIVIISNKEKRTIDFVDLANCFYHQDYLVYVYNIMDKKGKMYFELNNHGTRKYKEEKINQETQRLFNSLKTLQDQLRDQYYKTEIKTFKEVASKYNDASEKPIMTEDQRKFIVQANAMNDEKDYLKALVYYEKVMQINPTAYPAGYNNMALLAAQCTRYNYAIMCMKKYLMLVPKAEDARSVQDKIYEWEMKLEK